MHHSHTINFSAPVDHNMDGDGVDADSGNVIRSRDMALNPTKQTAIKTVVLKPNDPNQTA